MMKAQKEKKKSVMIYRCMSVYKTNLVIKSLFSSLYPAHFLSINSLPTYAGNTFQTPNLYDFCFPVFTWFRHIHNWCVIKSYTHKLLNEAKKSKTRNIQARIFILLTVWQGRKEKENGKKWLNWKWNHCEWRNSMRNFKGKDKNSFKLKQRIHNDNCNL